MHPGSVQNGRMEQDELSSRFQRDMKQAVDRMFRELNYHPTVFLRMLTDYGAVGAAKRLLSNPNYQQGFEKLFEHRRLEWSVEAHVVLPWYQPLFTVDEVFIAEDRLEQVGFDPRAFVKQAPIPDWVDAS